MLGGDLLNTVPAEYSPVTAPVGTRCALPPASTHGGAAGDRFDSFLSITYNDAHALTKPSGALGSDRQREADRQ